MSIKTEILNNLKTKLDRLGIFKRVERGLVFYEDIKKNDYPLCVFNSFKTEYNETSSTYNRQIRRLFVDIAIFDKHNKSKDYFNYIDDLEDKVVGFIECLIPNDLHQNVLNIGYITSEEVINDEYIDGLIYVKITIFIDYKK